MPEIESVAEQQRNLAERQRRWEAERSHEQQVMDLVTLLGQHVEQYDMDCEEHYGCSCGATIPACDGRSLSAQARPNWRWHLAEVIANA